MTAIFALALAYLIGSIPTGYLATRSVAGADIREHGSGGTGATNVQRVLGWRWGLAIALSDVAKGAVVVVLSRWLGVSEWFVAGAATLAVAGHCWPVWLRFRGGKGVATGGGAAIALSPWGLLLLPIIALPVVLTRYVSLGSVVASASAPVIFAVLSLLGVAPAEYVMFGLLASAIILAKHRTNIGRLLAGSERRIGGPRRGAPAA
ncbi:MAG TPA: glycerol-3-phosphate 1-O-acyltransferase PlsY [Thermomicrobiales bacterium]|nr:glycerol-3-phosphate 1-O-acyltransferase PlsY [Thermomicrobiales bacterium]